MYKQAADFAHEWIEAWNQHDLEAILAHYASNIRFTSCFVARLLNIQDGTIEGKEALRDYFQKGLAAFPALRFELIDVLESIGSVTLYYKSVNQLRAAEVMQFNPYGKVVRAIAHYSRP